jgi:hypothetical protein
VDRRGTAEKVANPAMLKMSAAQSANVSRRSDT